MKTTKGLIKLFLSLMILSLSSLTWANSYNEIIAVFKKSPELDKFFSNSYGYAVFPTIGKGGMVVGAAFGKGQVYRDGVVIGKSTVSQLSIGFQLGGQAFSQIVFFQNKDSFDEFTSTGFEFGAQATAVAITVGAQAQVGTSGATSGASAGPDSQSKQAGGYYKGMATFVHVKGGLMYEASVGGQKFTYEPNSTSAVAPVKPITDVN